MSDESYFKFNMSKKIDILINTLYQIKKYEIYKMGLYLVIVSVKMVKYDILSIFEAWW